MSDAQFIQLCVAGTVLPWLAAAIGHSLHGRYTNAALCASLGGCNILIYLVGAGWK